MDISQIQINNAKNVLLFASNARRKRISVQNVCLLHILFLHQINVSKHVLIIISLSPPILPARNAKQVVSNVQVPHNASLAKHI